MEETKYSESDEWYSTGLHIAQSTEAVDVKQEESVSAAIANAFNNISSGDDCLLSTDHSSLPHSLPHPLVPPPLPHSLPPPLPLRPTVLHHTTEQPADLSTAVPALSPSVVVASSSNADQSLPLLNPHPFPAPNFYNFSQLHPFQATPPSLLFSPNLMGLSFPTEFEYPVLPPPQQSFVSSDFLDPLAIALEKQHGRRQSISDSLFPQMFYGAASTTQPQRPLFDFAAAAQHIPKPDMSSLDVYFPHGAGSLSSSTTSVCSTVTPTSTMTSAADRMSLTPQILSQPVKPTIGYSNPEDGIPTCEVQLEMETQADREPGEVTCKVCQSTNANGLHFGARTCAACAAFFRRTVAEAKEYNCKNSSRCNAVVKDGTGYRKLCRACRFKKCTLIGMQPEHVQNKRLKVSPSSAHLMPKTGSKPGSLDALLKIGFPPPQGMNSIHSTPLYQSHLPTFGC